MIKELGKLGIYSEEELKKIGDTRISKDTVEEIKSEVKKVKEQIGDKKYLVVLDASKIGGVKVVLSGEVGKVLSKYMYLNFSNRYVYEEIYKKTLYKYVGLSEEEYEEWGVEGYHVSYLKGKVSKV